MPMIPLNIFITPFAERGKAETVAWTCDSAAEALRVVNRIWVASNIQFQIKACTVDTPLDIAKDSRTKDQLLLDVLSNRRPAGTSVNIFLVNRLAGLKAGGLSYFNSDPEAACFVQQYDDADSSGRAIAHELGHLLSLDHVKVDYTDPQKAAKLLTNLMVEGLSMGTDLSAPQITSAKASKLAKKFGG